MASRDDEGVGLLNSLGFHLGSFISPVKKHRVPSPEARLSVEAGSFASLALTAAVILILSAFFFFVVWNRLPVNPEMEQLQGMGKRKKRRQEKPRELDQLNSLGTSPLCELYRARTRYLSLLHCSGDQERLIWDFYKPTYGKKRQFPNKAELDLIKQYKLWIKDISEILAQDTPGSGNSSLNSCSEDSSAEVEIPKAGMSGSSSLRRPRSSFSCLVCPNHSSRSRPSSYPGAFRPVNRAKRGRAKIRAIVQQKRLEVNKQKIKQVAITKVRNGSCKPSQKPPLENFDAKTRDDLELHMKMKCLSIQLYILPEIVKRSHQLAFPAVKTKLKQLIPCGTMFKNPRPEYVTFMEQEAVDCLNLNLRHKHLEHMWGVATVYTKSMELMIPKAPPLPPRIKPSGAPVVFEAVDTPFLSKEIRDNLEFHVKRIKLQHQWGLPMMVQESLNAFIPPAPKLIVSELNPKPQYQIVVELSDLLFISEKHRKDVEFNTKRKIIHRRWGYPKFVLTSLKSMCPPASIAKDLLQQKEAGSLTNSSPSERGNALEKTSDLSVPAEGTALNESKLRSRDVQFSIKNRDPKVIDRFQVHLSMKSLAIKLEIIPKIVQTSYNIAFPVIKIPLKKVIPPGVVFLQTRPETVFFMEQPAVERIEMNLKHKQIEYQWGVVTMYKKSMALMIPKAPPLPPRIKPSGAPVVFEAVDTPFLLKEIRDNLEFHIKQKKLQHLWGLPLHVQKSIDAFIPQAPKIILSQLHPKPIYDIVVELSDLPFISKRHKKDIERNIRRKTIQKRWGLPKIVLESLRSIQPPAALIQDLQTDRAAAKTGLDKEETTLKSTDAKTDSKPENLEKLWTKTERMFQMYLFRKCLETRLQMLPAMVDRSYREAFPVLKVPLIQLIPPHTTVLKPRPGFIPFIEPQAIDRLELNLKHKRIDFLWAAPTLYTKSLQIMIPKAPPLPPLIKPSGAAVAFEAVDTPFLKKELRDDLEFHVKRKKLQHLWGLPLHVQESIDAFIPPAPKIILSQLHPKPEYKIVVELNDLPFITEQHKKDVEFNIIKKIVHRKWDFPKFLLTSLASFQPPEAITKDLLSRQGKTTVTGKEREKGQRKVLTEPKAAGKGSEIDSKTLTACEHQKYVSKKFQEIKLDMKEMPYQSAFPEVKTHLARIIPPGSRPIQPRPETVFFMEQPAVDRIELNLKHKQVEVEHKEAREKLPAGVQESVSAFIPPAPKIAPSELHPKADTEVVVELGNLPFVSETDKKAIDFNNRRKIIQSRMGFPKVGHESMKSAIAREQEHNSRDAAMGATTTDNSLEEPVLDSHLKQKISSELQEGRMEESTKRLRDCQAAAETQTGKPRCKVEVYYTSPNHQLKFKKFVVRTRIDLPIRGHKTVKSTAHSPGKVDFAGASIATGQDPANKPPNRTAKNVLSATRPSEEVLKMPGLKPQSKTELKPESKTGLEPESKTGLKPESKTGLKPESKTELKPESKTGLQPEIKTELKPESKTGLQPEIKTELKPESKTGIKPESKTGLQPEIKTELKPESKTGIKPESKTELKPESKTELKPESNTGLKPESKTGLQPEIKTELKPESKTGLQPEIKTELKPESKTELKPESKTGLQPEIKTELKPESKTGIKPESKTGLKPESKTGLKPESKTGLKPESKTGLKPESKTELKPKSKTGLKPKSKTGLKPESKTFLQEQGRERRRGGAREEAWKMQTAQEERSQKAPPSRETNRSASVKKPLPHMAEIRPTSKTHVTMAKPRDDSKTELKPRNKTGLKLPGESGSKSNSQSGLISDSQTTLKSIFKSLVKSAMQLIGETDCKEEPEPIRGKKIAKGTHSPRKAGYADASKATRQAPANKPPGRTTKSELSATRPREGAKEEVLKMPGLTELKPESKTGLKPESKTGLKPESKTRLKPESKTGLKPESKTRLKPESKTGLKPESKTGLKPESKTGLKPEIKTRLKPESKTGLKPESKTGLKPESKTGLKPESKTELKPESKTGLKPENKTGLKPESKTEFKPESKTGLQPETKTGLKPESKTGLKPESKTGMKPESKTFLQEQERERRRGGAREEAWKMQTAQEERSQKAPPSRQTDRRASVKKPLPHMAEIRPTSKMHVTMTKPREDSKTELKPRNKTGLKLSGESGSKSNSQSGLISDSQTTLKNIFKSMVKSAMQLVSETDSKKETGVPKAENKSTSARKAGFPEGTGEKGRKRKRGKKMEKGEDYDSNRRYRRIDRER